MGSGFETHALAPFPTEKLQAPIPEKFSVLVTCKIKKKEKKKM
jgi:hypothetical protein